MALDLPRIQSSVNSMSQAQAAYDAALREQAAAAALVTAKPTDTTAAKRAKVAATNVAVTRTALEQSRRQLDAARFTELLALDTGDRLLGNVAGHEVIALFPVGLEAKLDAGRRLRVRVWPDVVSSSTHDPRLTEAERSAGERYWRGEGAAASDADRRAAWRELAEALGPTRAAWVARALTPANASSLAPGVDPVFPTVAMLDEEAPFVPRASVLPDRWIAIGFRDGAKVLEQIGAPIPVDLATGLDTTPAETAALSNREGEPIQLPPRMRWMSDFEVAKQVGMALEIPLAANIDRIDLLMVFGVRVTQTQAQNASTVAELFAGHRFSRGLAFVAQDTPTNNSVAGGTGLPSRSQRIDAAYDLERRPRAFAAGMTPGGAAAARAFGIPLEVFAPLPGSGATTQLAAEPEGFESEIARAMQTALWSTTMGAALEDFLALTPARADAVRDYYRDHVRAAGPLPTIRVGRQPYGVLPVTQLAGFAPSPAEGIDARLLPVLQAARTWWLLSRQAEVYEGSPEEALRHLGRSIRLYAETVGQTNPPTASNRWANLASALAVATRNAMTDTWRTGPIRATVDGVPQPVARVIVDAALATSLSTYASSTPAGIRSAAMPTSVLGRIARHAALLEWGRFARTVCEAALDAGSKDALRRKAATSGLPVYLGVLERAFLPTVPIVDILGIGHTGVAKGKAPADRKPPGGIPDIPTDLPTSDLPVVDMPHPPHFTPEEQAVDATELQRVVQLVGNLKTPKATCPGAPRLASFRSALSLLAEVPGDRLEAAMFGTLDLCNHRVDAWTTSLATRRLATIRATHPDGLVIGGWGVLQDVRPANSEDPLQRAEFIHTPSLDQAAAAAVLRSATNRARAGGSDHADIDLSSRRVRLARWILDGVRNGRSIGELLGVRFERSLKGTAGEAQLGELRKRFSIRGEKHLLDGLELQQSGVPASSEPAVLRAAKGMEEALDAVTDALTAEAVYQLVRGNPGGALVGIEAIANGAAPPPLTFTETPSTASRIAHRIIVALPAGAKAAGWIAGSTPRSKADPVLDAWCGAVLGPPEDRVLTVVGRDDAVVSVPLAALNIAAVDAVLAARDNGAELAERVVEEARRRVPSIADPAIRIDVAWRDLVGLAVAIARMIARAEPLRPELLELPGALRAAANEDFGDLPVRFRVARQDLEQLREALVRRDAPVRAVAAAAAFGLRIPGALLGSTPTPEHLDGLLASLEMRLQASAAGVTPRDRLRALFGGELPCIVTFVPSDPTVFATLHPPTANELLAGDPLAPAAWLDAIGRTRPGAAGLAEILQRVEIAGGAAPLLVAQAPWTEGDRWIATSFSNPKTKQRPDGRLSLVMHAPVGFPATAPVGGLLLDSWTESVPTDRRDTSIALRFNSPGTRAPQSILLAVSPDPTRVWTTETLTAVLRDTMMLTRMRMQAPTAFSRGGHAPLAWLGQRPGNAGISFSL